MNHESFAFSSLWSSKTYWHWRNDHQIAASFHSVQNLLVLKHQVIDEQKLPLCTWQDFESTGMVRSPPVNLLWKICIKLCWTGKFYLNFTGLQFWCLFYLEFIFLFGFVAWEKITKLNELRIATTKFSKKTWIMTFQNTDLFLLEKCYLSWILPFQKIPVIFYVAFLINITFSRPQGLSLISDYQKKAYLLWVYHWPSPANDQSQIVTGSVPASHSYPEGQSLQANWTQTLAHDQAAYVS